MPRRIVASLRSIYKQFSDALSQIIRRRLCLLALSRSLLILLSYSLCMSLRDLHGKQKRLVLFICICQQQQTRAQPCACARGMRAEPLTPR